MTTLIVRGYMPEIGHGDDSKKNPRFITLHIHESLDVEKCREWLRRRIAMARGKNALRIHRGVALIDTNWLPNRITAVLVDYERGLNYQFGQFKTVKAAEKCVNKLWAGDTVIEGNIAWKPEVNTQG